MCDSHSANISCDLCPETFDDEHKFKDHIKRVHMKLQFFDCIKCESAISSEQHPENSTPHNREDNCKFFHDTASKVFNHLALHEKTKLNDEKKVKEDQNDYQSVHLQKIKSEVCIFETRIKGCSTSHKLLHDKKESCLVCQKLLGIVEMKNHMKIHAGERRKCISCNKKFENIHKLKW